jgi:hypothetical protein
MAYSSPPSRPLPRPLPRTGERTHLDLDKSAFKMDFESSRLPHPSSCSVFIPNRLPRQPTSIWPGTPLTPSSSKELKQESFELAELPLSSKASVRSYNTGVDSLLSASEKSTFVAELKQRQLKRSQPEVTSLKQSLPNTFGKPVEQSAYVRSRSPSTPVPYTHSNTSFDSPATTIRSNSNSDSYSTFPTRISTPTNDFPLTELKDPLYNPPAQMDFVSSSYVHSQCSEDTLDVLPPSPPAYPGYVSSTYLFIDAYSLCCYSSIVVHPSSYVPNLSPSRYLGVSRQSGKRQRLMFAKLSRSLLPLSRARTQKGTLSFGADSSRSPWNKSSPPTSGYRHYLLALPRRNMHPHPF